MGVSTQGTAFIMKGKVPGLSPRLTTSLGDKPGFVDSTEKLAARGAAIQALAETLRARYRTKEAMQNAGNPDEPLGVEELMHNLQSAKVSDEPKAKKRRTETEDDEADAGAARKPASQRSGKRSRSQK